MRIVNCEQGSDGWKIARLGIPTASQFHRIITPKTRKPSAQREDYIDQLLAEWAFGLALENGSTAFMERGTELEDDARDWYRLYGPEGVEVTQPGFVLSDCGRYGCSPDGLVGELGGLEIKIKSIANHIGELRHPDDDAHICQLQGSMLICERAWWDRVFYNPVCPSVARRMPQDAAFVCALASELDRFCDDLEAAKEWALDRGFTKWEPPVTEETTVELPDGRVYTYAKEVPTSARREPTTEEVLELYKRGS